MLLTVQLILPISMRWWNREAPQRGQSVSRSPPRKRRRPPPIPRIGERMQHNHLVVPPVYMIAITQERMSALVCRSSFPAARGTWMQQFAQICGRTENQPTFWSEPFLVERPGTASEGRSLGKGKDAPLNSRSEQSSFLQVEVLRDVSRLRRAALSQRR